MSGYGPSFQVHLLLASSFPPGSHLDNPGVLLFALQSRLALKSQDSPASTSMGLKMCATMPIPSREVVLSKPKATQSRDYGLKASELWAGVDLVSQPQ